MTIAAMEPTEAVAGKKTSQTPSLRVFCSSHKLYLPQVCLPQAQTKFTSKFSSLITFFSSNRHFSLEINRLRSCFVTCKACKKMHGHKGSVG